MTVLRFAAVVWCPVMLWAQAELNIEQGKATFRSNCAFCHGLIGAGGRGPNLISSALMHGSSDDAILGIIRNGVPGTTMPSFENFDKDELDNLVRYLKTLGGAKIKSTPVTGDSAKGRQVYVRNGCAACHRIGDEGSAYGPELTRVGAGRASEYIRESILDPSADIPLEYEGVTVVTKEGKRVTGVRVNEDTFTIQLRDPSQKFGMFQKSDLKEVIHEKRSLMPSYKNLPKEDLQNLLAYLDRLRGSLRSGAESKKAEGIR